VAQGQADGGGGKGDAQFLADASLLDLDRLEADSAMLQALYSPDILVEFEMAVRPPNLEEE
jgi:hypothetical protein